MKKIQKNCHLLFFMVLVMACSACKNKKTFVNVVADYGIANHEEIASGFEIPDGIEVISENEFLFVDRVGKLYHYIDGTTDSIQHIPPSAIIKAEGLIFGGLLDVSLHPNFLSNNLIYLAYVASDFKLTVAKFQIQNNKANNFRIIFKANQFSIGSRIAWQDSTHFFVSIGMGGTPYPDLGAQDLNDDRGKIHRLLHDGQIPSDNPIFPGKSLPMSIYTYGHRNPQGLFFDAVTHTLYENEHGPLGGDELNIISKGQNYGWPLFSYGLNYDMTPVSDKTEQQAAAFSVLPLKYWGPDFRVAPSGLLLLNGSNFTAWNGSFLMGSLYPQRLLRYNPQTNETEIVIQNAGMVRDIAMLPSKKLLISIDKGGPNSSDKGRIIKLSPKQ